MIWCCLRVLLRSNFSAKFHHRHHFQCGNRFHLFVLFGVFSLLLYDLVLCFFFSHASIHKFFYGERERERKKENNRVRKYNRWSHGRVIWWDDSITFLASCLTATLFFTNFQSVKLLLDLFLVDFYYILNFIIYFN